MMSPYRQYITTALWALLDASHGHLAVLCCAKAVGIQINWYLATNTYRYPFILSYTLLRTILNKATLRVYYHQFNGYTILLTR
jgi:hypothetical protein